MTAETPTENSTALRRRASPGRVAAAGAVVPRGYRQHDPHPAGRPRRAGPAGGDDPDNHQDRRGWQRESSGGLPVNGTTVTLEERAKNGHILIAAGGNGDKAGLPVGMAAGGPAGPIAAVVSSGGGATVIGGAENLPIALGGFAGSGVAGTGVVGGDGGSATAIGLGARNDLFVEGGIGGTGGTSAAGIPAVAGIRLLIQSQPDCAERQRSRDGPGRRRPPGAAGAAAAGAPAGPAAGTPPTAGPPGVQEP